MKDFVIKYKWVISTILIILMQVQELVEISQGLKLTVQILLIALTVLTQRAELLEIQSNNDAATMERSVERTGNKPRAFISITIHKMIWKLIKEIPTDFQRKNITWKENIPSHLLLGGGMLFLMMPFSLTGLPQWFILTFASFSAICLGMCIEAIQSWFFDGIPSDRDIRWGWYGYFLFIPVYFIFQNIGPGVVADILMALTLFLIAFVLHYLNRK
jgi:hypothetical protein